LTQKAAGPEKQAEEKMTEFWGKLDTESETAF
jgi:hypothetical protein